MMDQLKLRLPTLQDEEAVLDYKQEFLQSGDDMAGTGGLQYANTYQEWFAAWQANTQEETVKPSLVPATTFLAVRESDQKLVGMIDIRHRLNEHLLQFGGNIGYSIRKTQRRKGYATQMLGLALEECRKLSLDHVLITCDKENIGSAKTIQNNHGKLENEVEEGQRLTQRYWICVASKK